MRFAILTARRQDCVFDRVSLYDGRRAARCPRPWLRTGYREEPVRKRTGTAAATAHSPKAEEGS